MFNKIFKLMLSKKVITISLVLLLSLYISAYTYYTLIKKHTFQEWIVFSTDSRKIVNKVKELMAQDHKYELETYREWNRLGEWVRELKNPILTTGGIGSWDEKIATFASVIKDDDNFKMYYSGRNRKGAGQIGLCISKDGKRWKKYPNNPILKAGSSGSWDEAMIWCPIVWKEENTYHMIYTGRNKEGIIQIGYAKSEDGVYWAKYNDNPVFNDPAWAHNHTEAWGLIRVKDTYLLWYNTLGTKYKEIGLALSQDLINWSPYQDSPIFESIPGTDREHQFCVFPFKYDNQYYLLITSQDKSRNYGVFYLYKCKNPYFFPSDREVINRMLLPGDFGNWDDHDLDTPFILTNDVYRDSFYNNELWLYYSAESGDNRWKEGLVIEKDIANALRPVSLDYR